MLEKHRLIPFEALNCNFYLLSTSKCSQLKTCFSKVSKYACIVWNSEWKNVLTVTSMTDPTFQDVKDKNC